MNLEMGTVLTTLAFVLVAGLQGATPLAFAAVGGAFSSQVNVFNLGLEGMMIVGAFSGFGVAHATGNAVLGLLAGAGGGMVVATLFAIATIVFRADEIIVGFLLNLVMLALTAVLLQAIFNASGQFVSTTAGTIPKFAGGFDAMMIVALVVVVLAHVYLYHTRGGLRMRAIGGNPTAAMAAGVDVDGYRFRALLLGGALAGVGGAYLPISGLGMFTVAMTSGAGFIAVAAVLFGAGRPLVVGLAAALFGFVGAVAIPFQNIQLPTEAALVLPYIATIIAVAVKGIRAHRTRAA